MKHFLLSISLVILLAACTANPPDMPVTSEPNPPIYNPYSPLPGDDAMIRSQVYLDLAEILIMESYPVQISLHIAGNLPDPCHDLRVVIGQPDGEKRISVEVYSVADPMTICVAMLEPFDVSLNLGSFPAGHYTVLVNEEIIGEFDA